VIAVSDLTVWTYKAFKAERLKFL